MHDTSFISTVLHLTGFCVFNSFCYIRSYRADFGVRHQTTRTENGTKLTDNTHRIRRSNDNIKIQITCFDIGSQIFKTNYIGTSCFCSISICTLGKYGHTGCFTGTFGQYNRTTNYLVRFTGIYTQIK